MKSLKKIIALLLIFSSVAAIANFNMNKTESSEPYLGSSFDDVWEALQEDVYDSLPIYKIVSGRTLRSIGLAAFQATLDNRNDFRPRRTKLVHPNGICMAGVWEIDKKSEFTGYFSEGLRGVVIGRASTTQDFVKYEDHRAFGLAIKLFPTQDTTEVVFTSNLFAVDNIEGVKNRHYVETFMTNEIPDFDFLNLRALFRLINRMSFLVNFNNLSKEADTGPEDRSPLFRRTVEVARAGISSEFSSIRNSPQLPPYSDLERMGEINEPRWVGFEYQNEGPSSPQQSDFREEIADLIDKNGEIKYKILVASEKDRQGFINWKEIGHLTFTETVASKPCDLDLHFHHPRTDD